MFGPQFSEGLHLQIRLAFIRLRITLPIPYLDLYKLALKNINSSFYRPACKYKMKLYPTIYR
jgi:hypothetical protein